MIAIAKIMTRLEGEAYLVELDGIIVAEAGVQRPGIHHDGP